MPAPTPTARDRFLALLRTATDDGSLVKLTLGKPRGADPTLHNLFVRPVVLKSGPHLCFVWRHATRDVTKNLAPAAALAQLEPLIGGDFLDAHLFTAAQTAQLQCQPDGTSRLVVKAAAPTAAPAVEAAGHDRPKQYLIAAESPWLRALGITNDRGQPRAEMAAKFRQIQKFAELLRDLLEQAGSHEREGEAARRLRIVDMGCGKGYLTFAIAALLGERADVLGIESRPELVTFCNGVARTHSLANLRFAAGAIADAPLAGIDVLIALHACDTATDDALARGIQAGARLLLVAPCCQKELRPQLTAPPVLAEPLRHGIFQERQAEFVTDALRAQLLEWAGYRTKVFEFVTTEHTAKNLMIAAIKSGPAGQPDDAHAQRLRELARFYGIRRQRLAEHLAFPLT
ncbi:MAG: SAM-dependent methyltransferase [Opitutae bacterium]|nr:SAM-dependent methyltransferase [Opitutae bacterium]